MLRVSRLHALVFLFSTTDEQQYLKQSWAFQTSYLDCWEVCRLIDEEEDWEEEDWDEEDWEDEE